MNIALQPIKQAISERAQVLVERGIGRESLVALALPRGELVMWALACWRAGAAFLPIDLRYPADRIAFMIADARPALLMEDAKVTELDTSRKPVGAHDAGDLAYVIYTSGSTGKPKGVEVTHRGIANLAREQAAAFAIDASSRVLQFASPSFDAFVAEMVATLYAGATLVIPPAGTLGANELRALCAEEAITVATFPPSLLAILEPSEFPTLRTIVSAGEACSTSIVKRWAGRRFVNAYGPTEATVCATMAVIDGDDVPIGSPLEGVEALVLDEQLRPVDAGELYLGGIGLARGYRGRPALTAAAFVPHPTRAGERMYRTGDRVRRDERGSLHFVGRVDDQLKLRGFRIEPGEIEHALRALPEIADAVVVVRSGPRIGDQLVAYVVPRGSIDVAAIAAQLRTTLPAHMVPDVISAIGELPIGPNGKVDRAELPAPRPFRPAQLAAPSAPASEREAEIVRLYEYVLGIDRVGADDDFFALGGHSLAAMVVLGRLGGNLPMSVLVKNPTPRALAREVERAPADSPCVVPLRVDVRGRPGVFLVHPIGGNAGCYLDLAAALGDTWPVYGIQNPALVTGDVGPRTIEDMSEEYARAIRAVQPFGPYIIGGWSVGGNFAIEVARVLGDEAGPLVLLDSWSPTLVKQKPVIDDAMATFFFIKNNVGRAAGVDIPITPDDTRPLSPEARMELVRSWLARIGTMPADIPLSSLRRLVDVFAQTARVHLAYQPTLFTGHGVHLEASTPAKNHPRPPSLGWDEVLPNVRRIVVPDTTHYVFVYPPMVQRVAAYVRETLA